jgi:His/Glu/Gln/Arg/opine family amino acid ABC transporter permease subunit
MMNSALLYIPKLLTGAWLTLQLTGTAVLLGGLLALPLAIALYEQRRGIRHPIALLLSFLRGTPLLAQLFLIYYGAGQFRPELQAIGLWTFFREPFHCALLAFTLNTAAYQTAILRGGLLAVSSGEIEAARAYGFSRWQLYRLIILPNAYRLALPALGNELILLLKGGAVASIVTLLDLMGQTRKLYAQTFDFTVYCYAAIGYLCITSTLLWVWHRLALHLNRHRIVTARPRRRWILTADRS